jgi:hypothetical protein
MNNEPVAWMVAEMVFTIKESAIEMAKVYEDEIIPLYTHLAEHDLGIAEAIGFDKGYKANQKEPYNNAVGKTIESGAELVCDWDIDVNKWITSVKTLTNDEILCLWDYWSGEILAIDILDFADKYKRAILNEKGIIEWHQEYCKKMNEEDAKKVDTYKSQKNNQIDTYRYKNLTDEEIANTWDDVRKDATLKSSMKDIQDFARAILRKAQDK